jgi:hypothetical protein
VECGITKQLPSSESLQLGDIGARPSQWKAAREKVPVTFTSGDQKFMSRDTLIVLRELIIGNLGSYTLSAATKSRLMKGMQ